MDTRPDVETPELEAVARISERVRTRFPDAPPQSIDQAITQALHEYDGRPIRDFVPILVERHVVEQLQSTRAGARAS